MSHSTRPIEFVVVYDAFNDLAAWMLYSEATTLCKVNPCCDLIDETHPARAVYEKMAGPKPVVYIQATEDYGDAET